MVNSMQIPWSYLPHKFPPDVVAEMFGRMNDQVIRDGDFTLGKAVFEFEEKFAAKVGAKHAIGVANGTDALRISLLACGVGAGDEVILPAHTFVATAGAIREVGAIPVFVDIDNNNFCMDWTKIACKITHKTRAIIPVHWSGHMADMDRIMELAAEYHLSVIEDAAQAIMSSQRHKGLTEGKKAGTWGNLGCFSLHPLKNVSVWGDGGVIVTDDDARAEWIRRYRNHGLIARNTVAFSGCNSRLDSLQAVVGSWLLESVDWLTEQRIKNAAFLDAELRKISGVTIPRRLADRVVTYTQYEVFFERRDEMQAFLKEHGVETLIHYPQPCYWNECFQFGCKKGDFPVADRHAATKLSLPMHEHISQAELEYIVEKVRTFYVS